MPDGEDPNAGQMDAVAGEVVDAAVIDEDRVLVFAVVRLVQVDAVDAVAQAGRRPGTVR